MCVASISPGGQTPPQSEKNMPSLEEDEITEEIEEDLSVGEDLLKSETSAVSVDLSMHYFVVWM